jgi:ABC-type amino acid transport substrate-binding protein
VEIRPLSLWQYFSKSGRRRIILCLAAIACLASPAVAGAQEGQRINKVKAAFVLNVARFVTWPEEVFDGRDGRLLLCFYRTNPFDVALDSISGKTVSGRQLEIIQIENLQDSEPCQILLISPLELDDFMREARPGLTSPLLTIVDMTDTAEGSAAGKGVLITLVRKGSRIGFEIDLARARSAGLKMSSELLKHAHIVGGGS